MNEPGLERVRRILLLDDWHVNDETFVEQVAELRESDDGIDAAWVLIELVAMDLLEDNAGPGDIQLHANSLRERIDRLRCWLAGLEDRFQDEMKLDAARRAAGLIDERQRSEQPGWASWAAQARAEHNERVQTELERRRELIEIIAWRRRSAYEERIAGMAAEVRELRRRT